MHRCKNDTTDYNRYMIALSELDKCRESPAHSKSYTRTSAIIAENTTGDYASPLCTPTRQISFGESANLEEMLSARETQAAESSSDKFSKLDLKLLLHSRNCNTLLLICANPAYRWRYNIEGWLSLIPPRLHQKGTTHTIASLKKGTNRQPRSSELELSVPPHQCHRVAALPETINGAQAALSQLAHLQLSLHMFLAASIRRDGKPFGIAEFQNTEKHTRCQYKKRQKENPHITCQ